MPPPGVFDFEYSSQTSPTPTSYPSSPANMTKPSSSAGSDSSKSGKRKGTRSVSTLTPSQLARKRANDREAQRAIRARTKEHIETLERELDDLRSQQSRDKTVQDLLRRNKALEDELIRLKESMGIPTAGPSGIYPQAYHGANPRASPFGHPSPPLPLVQPQDSVSSYSSISEPCEHWPTTVPCSVPSTVSSPSSSGAPDDMCGNYMPTSAPAGLLDRSGMASAIHSPSTPIMNGKMGFEDIKSEFGCPQVSVVPIHPSYHHQASLDMYQMYYPASPATL